MINSRRFLTSAVAIFTACTLLVMGIPALDLNSFDLMTLGLSITTLLCSFYFVQRYLVRVRRRYDKRASRMLEERSRLQLQHQALLKLATSDARRRDLTFSIQELLETAAHTLDVEQVSLWLCEPHREKLECFDMYEKSSGTHSSGLQLFAAHAPCYFDELNKRRVIVVSELEKSPFSDELQSLWKSGVSSIIDSPVRLHGALSAVVCFRQVGEPRRWNTDEQNFAASIGDMAALAFQADEQERIKEELEQKSCAIESASDGMAILDANQTYVYLNQAHAEMYGYANAADLIGQSWRVLYADSERERFEETLIPQFLREGQLQTEAVGKRRDGTLFPQEISLTALDNGGLICVVRDSTARKLTEQNAEQMALFAKLHPAPVLRFNEFGIISSANPSAREILGLPLDETTPIASVIPGAAELDLERCIRESSVLNCSSRIGERHFHFLFRGVRELACGHVYGTDITDLKRAHQRLIDSKRFLRRVIDSDPNLIYVKDGQGRFTLANQATALLYGSTVNDILWKTDADLLQDPNEISYFRRHEREVVESQQERQGAEESFTDAAGKTHLLRTVRRPLRLTPDGEVHVLGVATDITETKRLQEDLLHSQKMEAIGQLAGGIAHDFNNLLTGILGCTGLLKMKGEREPEVYQGAEMIENAATRAGQLTQKLLGFARKGKHQNIPVDLHNTIEETVSLLRRTIEKNIAIVQLLQAPQAFILGDPTQIQQIILNLAINARDAMSLETDGTDGGELTISTRVLPASEVARDDAEQEVESYLEIVVRDTGCGIPEGIREKVFEPFFTTKSPGRGTGMGLAMVYGIVRNHEGFITVDSEVGQGTAFRVYLPSLDPQTFSSISPPVQTAISGRGQILVVDDHNVVRSVTAKMLQSLGYGVITARDGLEAVEYYREHYSDLDLVLVDMIMPRMGARECIKILKEINPAVRAVLSTGYVNNNAVQEIMNQGVCAFIQKPYQINQLSTVVAAALREGAEHTGASSPQAVGPLVSAP